MCRLLMLAVVVAAVGVLVAPEASAQTCSCPKPPTQPNFDPDSYLGDWFEMQTVPRSFEEGGQCGTAHYEWNADKSAVSVTNANYVPSMDVIYTVNLLATPDTPNGAKEGKFTVTWPSKPSIPKSMYWVLATDYDSHAVVYSCSEPVAPALLPHVTLWVLSKHPDKFTSEVETKVQKIITDAGLDASILKKVDHQKGCPSSTNCNKICTTPKANLDLAKLKGRWWQVQHSLYSTGSEKQSCNSALVSSTDKGVKLDISSAELSSDAQTVTEQGQTLEGTWVDAKTKSGAFSVNGQTGGKVCIIDTDYENWAVASLCLLPQATTTPPPGFESTIAGGLLVLARGRGLNAAQQMAANKAVIQAGVAPTTMQATPSTPCPKAAADTGNGSPSAAASSIVAMVLASVAVLASHLRTAQ